MMSVARCPKTKTITIKNHKCQIWRKNWLSCLNLFAPRTSCSDSWASTSNLIMPSKSTVTNISVRQPGKFVWVEVCFFPNASPKSSPIFFLQICLHLKEFSHKMFLKSPSQIIDLVVSIAIFLRVAKWSYRVNSWLVFLRIFEGLSLL